MTRLRVKICGLQQPEHAVAAAHAGADYVGVIFASVSKRQVTVEQAKAVSLALRSLCDVPQLPQLVGVFVNESAENIARIVEICRLDLVQLSGDESWGLARSLPVPAIKVLRLPADTNAAAVIAELTQELPLLAAKGGLCLIESQVSGQYGGTGQRLDRTLAQTIAQQTSFLLSGGLTPDNVGEAVAQVQPWGVDVASGVETGGMKDIEKIQRFIRTARGAAER